MCALIDTILKNRLLAPTIFGLLVLWEKIVGAEILLTLSTHNTKIDDLLFTFQTQASF